MWRDVGGVLSPLGCDMRWKYKRSGSFLRFYVEFSVLQVMCVISLITAHYERKIYRRSIITIACKLSFITQQIKLQFHRSKCKTILKIPLSFPQSDPHNWRVRQIKLLCKINANWQSRYLSPNYHNSILCLTFSIQNQFIYIDSIMVGKKVSLEVCWCVTHWWDWLGKVLWVGAIFVE